MAMSIQLSPGVHFDLRSSLIGIAALFGGPVSAALSLLPPLLYRVYLGGVGVSAGAAVLCASSLLGLAAKLWLQDRPISIRLVTALAVGIAGFTELGLYSITGLASHEGWLTNALAIGFLSFAATVIAGYFLVSARREAAEREILTAAFMQTPDFNYVKNRRSEFVAVNKTTSDFAHYARPADLVGLTDFDLTEPERAAELYRAEQEAMTSYQAILDEEELLRGSDGEERWYRTSKTPLRNPDGQVIGLAGVTRDITKEKQIAADLQESRNRLSYVLGEMVDGIAMFHKEGTLLFSNEQYRDLFPLTKAARRTGMDLRDILPAVEDTGEQIELPEDREAWTTAAMRALKEGGDEQIHMYDGRWLHLRTRPTKEATSIVLVSDITASKRIEFDLRDTTQKLRHLAEEDGLTGLPNRRTFDQAMAKELARTERSGAPLSLLMIDVDKFKAYNDAYGHVAGDACLRILAGCLRAAIKRPMDVAARYGGEEFAVILPETDEDGAYHVALSVVGELRAAAIPHSGSDKGRVTVSIGTATYGPGTGSRSADELIERADRALYGAKMAGRDRINGRSGSKVIRISR